MNHGAVPDYTEVTFKNGKVKRICAECGGQRRPGDWPYCRGKRGGHRPGRFGNDPLDSYVDADIMMPSDPRVRNSNHYTEHGRKGLLIESRSHRRAIMSELNLQFGSQNHHGGKER